MKKHGRLSDTGLLQVFFCATEHYIGNAKLQNLVCLFEQFLGKCAVVVMFLPHPWKLRALARENICVFHVLVLGEQKCHKLFNKKNLLAFRSLTAIYLFRFAEISLRNSLRVEFLWNSPSNAEVVVIEFCFCTPRIIMQRCCASITTATPRGLRVSLIAFMISTVRRSCTWSLLAYTSTTRASLLRPVIHPLGMYAMCALPKKGRMWCSHMLKSSISFTRIISLTGS